MKLAGNGGRNTAHHSLLLWMEKSLGSAKWHTPWSEYETSNELVWYSEGENLSILWYGKGIWVSAPKPFLSVPQIIALAKCSSHWQDKSGVLCSQRGVSRWCQTWFLQIKLMNKAGEVKTCLVERNKISDDSVSILLHRMIPELEACVAVAQGKVGVDNKIKKRGISSPSKTWLESWRESSPHSSGFLLENAAAGLFTTPFLTSAALTSFVGHVYQACEWAAFKYHFRLANRIFTSIYRIS